MSVQHWCRTCFTPSPDMIPIFDKSKNDDEANVIVEVLQALVGHPVLPTDNASHFICSDCLSQIYNIHPFLLRCKKSDITFRQLGESQVSLRRLDDPMKFLEFVIDEKPPEISLNGTSSDKPDQNTSLYNGHNNDDSTVLDLTAESGDEIQSDEDEQEAGEEILECPACLDAFGMISVLRAHLVEVHTMNSQCIICNNAYYEDIWKHTREHVQRKYSCNECEKVYIRSSTLQRHIFKHIAMREKLTCELCHAQLDTEEELQDHFDRVHIHCRICSKTLANRKSLLRHKKIHLRLQEYSCDICNRKYKKKESYDSHMAVFHRPMQEQMMVFNQHYDGSSTNYGVYGEPLVDPLMSIFSIDDDDEATMASKDEVVKLDDDEDHGGDDISTGGDEDEGIDEAESDGRVKKEATIKCNECSQLFRTIQGLRGHMSVHTGERPFECHVCHKSFRVKRNLREHLISHSKDTPYKCGFCSIAYKKRYSVITHIQSRHKDACSFPCGSCEAILFSLNDLSEHWKTAHRFSYSDVNIQV